MKKKDFVRIFASIVLLSVVALLIFLLHNTKDSDDILSPNTTESSEEMPVSPKQDSGDAPAESVLGKRVQTTDEEKLKRICRKSANCAVRIIFRQKRFLLNIMVKKISDRKTLMLWKRH